VRSDEIGSMGYAPLYLPLRASMRIRGVLAVRFAETAPEPSDGTTSLLETVASLIAVAVERLERTVGSPELDPGVGATQRGHG